VCSGCFHRITAIVAYGVIYLVVVLSECGCSLLPEFVAKSRNSRRGKGPVFWPSKEKQRILCKNLVAAVGLEPDVFPKDRHLDPTTCSRMMSFESEPGVVIWLLSGNATGNFFAGTPSRKAKAPSSFPGRVISAGAGPHKFGCRFLHKRLMSGH